jgi:cell division protein FtsZ
MEFEFDTGYESTVKIKVIGVGGGGNNAVKRMVETNIRGVEFIAINTDRQALNISSVPHKLVIGKNTTGGKGAGANPAVGKASAEESREEIKAMLEGADMVFITAGMGGGTGTGAAPVVASIARELGILTVAIVTKPFNFEARRRMVQAEAGIEELSKVVDSIIVIPNERLKQIEAPRLAVNAAFEIADDVLRKGVQSVSEVINFPGFINLDFADVTTIMKDAGYAHMGVGSAKGSDKARLAATMAISSPLLSTSIAGATGVLISITYSPDVTMDEIDEASMMIHDEAHPDANIIWGATSDESLEDEIRITIIATGFNNQNELINSTASATRVTPTVNERTTDTYNTPAYTTSAGVERSAADVFGTADTVANSAYSDISAAQAASDVTVSEVPDTTPVAQDTPVATVTQSETQTTDTDVQSTCQEYEELFKCIKRIKKS